jgi:large subunit ribosomal protein L29
MATTTAASELRELTDDELVLRLRESKEELFNLRFQMATAGCARSGVTSLASTP